MQASRRLPARLTSGFVAAPPPPKEDTLPIRLERDRRGRLSLVFRLHSRFASHALIVVLVALVGAAGTLPGLVSAEQTLRTWVFEPFNRGLQSGDFLPVHPLLSATDGRGRLDLVTYVIRSGDTVSDVAYRYGVSTDTVVWANDIANLHFVLPGDSLRIPPMSGVLHTVADGETLDGLANKYKVTIEDVMAVRMNQIPDSGVLTAGQSIMFPGGIMPVPVAPSPMVSSGVPGGGSGGGSAAVIAPPGRLNWPASGFISQYFSWGHQAIDIAAPVGKPLYAVNGGVIKIAATGWQGGYGNYVDIDHGDGFISRYSHLSSFAVQQGQSVSKGQVIGYIGLTGITTGPHVHFELHYQGKRVNPLPYLG